MTGGYLEPLKILNDKTVSKKNFEIVCPIQLCVLQLKRYDEVMEEFRQQRYFLRNIILKGSDQERTQLVYSWLQVYCVLTTVSDV